MRKKFILKVLSAVFGLVISLVLCESALRLTGYALMLPQKIQNIRNESDAKILRILVLGESTSVENFADGVPHASWPTLLARRLSSLGIAARVYSEAEIGTSTPFILKQLPNWIRYYRPHIIVSMIGINDHGILRLDPLSEDICRKLNIFRTAEFLCWIYSHSTPENLDFDLKSKLRDHFYEDFKQGLILLKSKEYTAVRKIVADQNTVKGLALIALDMAVECRNSKVHSDPQNFCYELSTLAFSHWPEEPEIQFVQLLMAGLAEDLQAQEEVLKVVLASARTPEPKLLSLIAGGFSSDISPEIQRVLLKKYNLYSEKRIDSIKNVTMRKIHDLIVKENIFHMLMQYPTLSIEKLKEDYGLPEKGGDNSYTYIENLSNFSEALRTHSYDDLFTDRFAETWGHFTEYGADLVAESVEAVVIDLLQKQFLTLEE